MRETVKFKFPSIRNGRRQDFLSSLVLAVSVDALPVSTNGSCGVGLQYACAPGFCCSKWGFCGTSDVYCGAGCQVRLRYPTSRVASVTRAYSSSCVGRLRCVQRCRRIVPGFPDALRPTCERARRSLGRLLGDLRER